MRVSFLISIFVLLSTISFLFLMADESNQPAGGLVPSSGEDGAVHIVYVDRPVEEEPEAFHIRTLASVVGGEDAAKEALIYHYKHAASGFSAKLTPQQVADLSQKPEVIQVVRSGNLQLHSGTAADVRRQSLV